jgi:tetratricopeptide (TPR) repeat protein
VKHLLTLSAFFWLSTIIFSDSPVFGRSKLSIDRHQKVTTSDYQLSQSLSFGSGRISRNIHEQANKLLSVSPDFHKALKIHKTNNYSLAIKYYNRTLSNKWPQSAIAYFFRSQCFYSLNQYERAFADINTAIQIIPDFAHAYLFRGYIYGQTGSLSLARNDFTITAKLAINDKNSLLQKLATNALGSTPSSYPVPVLPVLSPTMISPFEKPIIPYKPME